MGDGHRGTPVLGSVNRFDRSRASAAATAIPTVDHLVMTGVVDNGYDVFAIGGKMADVTVQRIATPWPRGSRPMLLSEYGLASHLASVWGRNARRSCSISRGPSRR
jgi:hypothetical protein